MQKSMMKKLLAICVIVVVLTGVCYISFNDKKSQKTYAETIFKEKIESETEKIEEVLAVDRNSLEENEQLSTAGTIICEDKNDNLYQIRDDEIVGFFNCEDDEEIMELSLAQIETIAEEYLHTLSNSDRYILDECKYNEYRDTYRYYYYYHLGEYKTTDVVYIEIDKFGNIKSFAKPNEGLFDDINIELLSEAYIKEKAIEMTQYNIENIDIIVDDIIIEKEETIRY